MEQVMRSETAPSRAGKPEKWVDGVLKLIHLTQDGTLGWALTDPSDPAFAYAYRAAFEGNVVILERTLLVDPHGELDNSPILKKLLIGLVVASKKPSENIILKVQKPDGTLLTRFPMIAPLRGLVAAVEAQVSRESDAFLDALAAA